MDANTTLALVVAGAVTPWIVEIIKNIVGGVSGRWALTVTLISSIIISVGVLAWQGALSLANPEQILGSISVVAAVSMSVYQYMKKAVQEPVTRVSDSIKAKVA